MIPSGVLWGRAGQAAMPVRLIAVLWALDDPLKQKSRVPRRAPELIGFVTAKIFKFPEAN